MCFQQDDGTTPTAASVSTLVLRRMFSVRLISRFGDQFWWSLDPQDTSFKHSWFFFFFWWGTWTHKNQTTHIERPEELYSIREVATANADLMIQLIADFQWRLYVIFKKFIFQNSMEF